MEYAIVMLNPEGRISTWNAGAQRMFGHSEAEAIGLPMSILFTPEDRILLQPEHALKTARREAEIAHEHWLMRKDGSSWRP